MWKDMKELFIENPILAGIVLGMYLAGWGTAALIGYFFFCLIFNYKPTY